MSARWMGALVGLCAALMACKEATPQAKPTTAEQRGREIYTRGISPTGGQILARVSREGEAVPASMLPCVGCHGPDGRGRPEGGVAPSNIRWSSLTRPYEATAGTGRRHPPYTEPLFRKAVALGVDPAGQPLHEAMPRYTMSRADSEDLVAYLKALSQQVDPGVSADELRIGFVSSEEAGAVADGRVARAMVEALFAELNRRGGIYGRRLVLRSGTLPAAPPQRVEALRRFLETEKPFALVGMVLGGEEDGVPELLGELQVPLVGALSAFPSTKQPVPRYIFYLYSGVAEQAQVLMEFAGREKGSSARIAIVHPDSPDLAEVARRLVALGQERGLTGGSAHVLPAGGGAGLAAELARRKVEAILFLGPWGEEQPLWDAVGRDGWEPLLLVPGSVTRREGLPLPSERAGRLLMAFPTSPAERTPEAMRLYERLATAYTLPRERLSTQLSALAGASLLAESVVAAGHDLSRERLVDVLEKTRDFKTGLVPPLTFGRARRQGSRGAYILEVGRDGRVKPLGGWVAVE